MSRLGSLIRDIRGAAIIEFAIILPVLVLFVYGIFVVGQLFQANAGMQHALGEGARYATLYPTPTDAQIQGRVSSKVFGVGSGTFTVAAPANGTRYKDLSVTYSMPMDFLLFTGPTVTITRTKRVYTA